MRIRSIAVLAMAMALVLAPAGQASRRPTKAENRAILRAFGTGGVGGYPPGYAILYVRVSTADRRWAAVHIVPARGHANQVQPDFAAMYHLKRGPWVVHQVGSGGKHCGMPPAVVKDLHLPCP